MCSTERFKIYCQQLDNRVYVYVIGRTLFGDT